MSSKPSARSHGRPPTIGLARLRACSIARVVVAFLLAFTSAFVVALAEPSFAEPALAERGEAAPDDAALPAPNAALPVEVVFVLDNSGSMRAHDPGFLTRRAVSTFADALAARGREQGFAARIGVVLFDEDVELALPLGPVDPDSASAILEPALARLDYSGKLTRSADAIERALYALRPSDATAARQAIVLLTDGKLDTGDPGRDYDAATWLREDLAGESRERGIRIFGLAFTDRADYQLLQAIARKTDAAYYRATRAEELEPITTNVLARLTDPAPASNLASRARPGESDAAARSTQAASAPDVAAAPIARTDESSGLGRLGWLPILVLLVAAGGFVGLRARARERAAATSGPDQPAIRTDLPPAQLLDVGGVLGETGRAIPLQPGRTRIGRDPNNDVVIADDTISSEHAVIELFGGRYWLEDLRSTNGTRHGDQRLGRGERVVLKGGDHVRFADIDLMFVFAGYVPGGATVLLPSTSAPPSHWLASRPGTGLRIEAFERDADPEDAAAPALEAPADGPVASASGNGAPTPIQEAAERIEAEVTLPDVDEQTRPDGSTAPARAEDPMAEAFRACLDDHLGRVAELAPAFAQLVERAFHEEMREAIRVAAGELVRSAQREDRLERRAYTRDRVRYVLCGAPGGMEVAARTYQAAHGGFMRFLTEEISSESFRADRCELLAVLTFGRAADMPWVSLTVVPDEHQDPRIDLLSYELLTDAERQAIEPQTQHEVSQTGHA